MLGVQKSGPEDSSSLNVTTTKWQLGDSVSGVIVSDSVTLGTAILQRMQFGAANLINTNFNDDVGSPWAIFR